MRLACALAVLAVATGSARAAGVDCMGAEERRWVMQALDKYALEYDVTKHAQALIALNSATLDLEDRLKACRDSGTASAGGCGSIARELEASKAQRERAADSLRTALQMQPYLSTLQIRLERPSCQ
ncbi:MAG TPA: hypothetical protein VFB08_06575 [Burkholderiales bacterium]|nr:hypothetical protein [Burkholderiales bacterium]